MHLLFVEPPKDYWFLMGEYLPPPTGLLALAGYVERELPDVEITIMDCQAERRGWDDLRKGIEMLSPDIVAASGFTCNAYVCARAAQEAKTVDPSILTVLGGQHFTATAEESLSEFPEIDVIVRGEGELTLVDLIGRYENGGRLVEVPGISFRSNTGIVHNAPRPLIENLDTLPYPAYHLVEKNLSKYHFSMMAGRNSRYLIMEGGRGCTHQCSFCTQWRHWNGIWRTKSPGRIATEMEHLHDEFGGQFLWLTDDNFDYRARGEPVYQELKGKDFIEDTSWFFQARPDDVAENPDLAGRLRDVGNTWLLLGVENDSSERLNEYRKGEKVGDAVAAVDVLKRHDIFCQSMIVIGSRKDTRDSIESTRRFGLDLDSDLVIYTVLTPFPGTSIGEAAKKNGWIEDGNYAHYDMAHATMPTETLSRKEVQEELLECYRSFYGSIPRNISGFFSRNEIKRRTYRHMAGKGVIGKLRRLV